MLIDFLTEYEREKRFYIFVSSDLDQIIMCNILRLQICSPGNSWPIMTLPNLKFSWLLDFE